MGGPRTYGGPQSTPMRGSGWEHPAVREVAALLYRLTWNDQDTLKLHATVLLAVALAIAHSYAVHDRVAAWTIRRLPAAAHVPFFAVYIVFGLVVVLNAIQLLRKYRAPLPSLAGYALTRDQKRLLGLDPDTPTAPGGRFAGEHLPCGRFELSDGSTAASSNSSIRSPDKPATTVASPYTFRELQTLGSPRGSSASAFNSRYAVASPAVLGQSPIRDRRNLRALLNATSGDAQQSPTDGNDAAAAASSMWHSPLRLAGSVVLYQPARKAVRNVNVDERIEDGVLVKDPQKVFEEWNIEPYIDEWVDKMREWVSKEIIEMYARRISVVDSQLRAAGLGHLSCRGATLAAGIQAAMSQAQFQTTALINNARGQASSGLGPTSQISTNLSRDSIHTLVDLMQASPNNAVVKERLTLENVLTIPGYTCREYIVDRIKELASRHGLGDFIWDGGSDFQGKPWSADYLPTDSQLIMHLFCHYMDEKIPSYVGQSNPFTSKYFVSVEGKLDPSQSDIQIRHYAKSPPHYQIVAEGTAYDCFSGRNNVFSTLCLFAYYILHQDSGHIGVLYTAGKSMHFMEPVRHGPEKGKFASYTRHRGPPA